MLSGVRGVANAFMNRVNPPYDHGRRGMIKRSTAGTLAAAGGLGALLWFGGENHNVPFIDFSKNKILNDELVNCDFLKPQELQRIYQTMNFIYGSFYTSAQRSGLLNSQEPGLIKIQKSINIMHQILTRLNPEVIKDETENSASLISEALLSYKAWDCDTAAKVMKIVFDAIPELGLKTELAITTGTDLDSVPNREHMVLRYKNGNEYSNFNFYAESLQMSCLPFSSSMYYAPGERCGFRKRELDNFGFLKNLNEKELEAEALASIATYYSQKEKYKKAHDFIKRAADLAPRLIYLKAMQASIAAKAGEDFETPGREAANQKHSMAVLTLASEIGRRDGVKAGLEVFDEYINKFPHLAPLYNDRSTTHLYCGNIDQGLADMEKYMSIAYPNEDAESVKESKILSLIKVIEGEKDENPELATKAFRKMHELSPDDMRTKTLQKELGLESN